MSYRTSSNNINIIGTTSEAQIPGSEGVNECICPSDKVTYNCTVQGNATGATVWNGAAFSGCPQNEILLQHHQFTQTGGPTGTCNNGAIVGQSLGVQGNNYTSQLNVTITPKTAGRTITCAYDALTGQDTMITFSKIIPGINHPSCSCMNNIFVNTLSLFIIVRQNQLICMLFKLLITCNYSYHRSVTITK